MCIGMMRPATISPVRIYVIGTITLRACCIKTEYKYGEEKHRRTVRGLLRQPNNCGDGWKVNWQAATPPVSLVTLRRCCHVSNMHSRSLRRRCDAQISRARGACGKRIFSGENTLEETHCEFSRRRNTPLRHFSLPISTLILFLQK